MIIGITSLSSQLLEGLLYNVLHQLNEAFVQSPNVISYNGVQMVAFYCEETGLGHNEIKSADESAFLGQFANCVKAMDFF